MRVAAVTVALMLLSSPVWGEERTVTYFFDGARIEHRVPVSRGYAEVILPASVRSNSLRLKPSTGNDIVRVEQTPMTGGKGDREYARLVEQRERLMVRLKALETREEIFTAAAKSQSAKAPRKTKTNPEPLAGIRRGTDYALAQLEEVYNRRRQAEKALQEVDTKLAALQKRRDVGKTVARVWLKRNVGDLAISYSTAALSWKPFYDFRVVNGGRVAVSQHAVLPLTERGAHVFVTPTFLDSPVAGQKAAVENFSTVQRWEFPADRLTEGATASSSVRFYLTNSSGQALPAGDGACYRMGEYLGRVSFSGLAPGETREIACGL